LSVYSAERVQSDGGELAAGCYGHAFLFRFSTVFI
jgi:hypothetical protein